MPPEEQRQTPPVCDYEGSDYQSTFWDQADRQYEDKVEEIALRRLLPPQGDLLLETGAGAGRNTPRYTGFKHVVVLDYSLSQIEQARRRLGADPEYIFVVADAYRLPFVAGLFDTSTMIRVIHHMSDAPLALHTQHRVLAPGGTFILEFANKRNIKSITRYLLRRQAWDPFSREPVEFAELNFDFHPRAMRGWLEQAGFSIQEQLTVSHFRMALLKRLLPTSILVSMDSAIQRTGNLWQLTPSVFVRATADKSGSPAQPGRFFACPECNSDLPGDPRDRIHEADITCASCGHLWEVREGIYIFK
ncbi:MAG: class I SAM-dependent methyltransferase [Anaerolineales bacterium]|nr:class I SAM-dependent methyltransferase [Anaerolineales bacterium]